MQTVFKKTPILTDAVLHYCPGCGHGIVHRLVAEVVDELGIQDRNNRNRSRPAAQYSDINTSISTPSRQHTEERPPLQPVLSASNPNNVFFTYQGDGDLASIGTAEIVHAHTAAKRSPRSSSTMQFTA